MNRRTLIALPLLALAVIPLSACNGGNSSVNSGQSKNNTQLGVYKRNQPAPAVDFSEYRQTSSDPIKSCESSGYPIATTSQLTNPQRAYGLGNNQGLVIEQSEPNGMYTGDLSVTYVHCITPSGSKSVTHWERYVEIEGSPAHWDDAKHQIVLDGEPTVKISGKTAKASASDASRATR